MKIIWVLIVVSEMANSGVGFSHVFYTEKACQIAAEHVNKVIWGDAFCVQDEIKK